MIAVDTTGGLNRWTYSTSDCTLDPAVVGPESAVATVSRCAGGLRRLVVHSATVDKAPWVGSLPTGSDPHVLAADGRVVVLAGNTLSTYSVGEDKNHKTVASPAGDVLRRPAGRHRDAGRGGRRRLPRRVDRQDRGRGGPAHPGGAVDERRRPGRRR